MFKKHLFPYNNLQEMLKESKAKFSKLFHSTGSEVQYQNGSNQVASEPTKGMGMRVRVREKGLVCS